MDSLVRFGFYSSVNKDSTLLSHSITSCCRWQKYSRTVNLHGKLATMGLFYV